MKEDGIRRLSGFTVTDADFDPAAHVNVLLEATVSASHGGVLEVQTVTTKALHVDPIQTVTITALPLQQNSITGGTITLGLDLTAFGLGVVETEPIEYDAVGMRWAELTDATSEGQRPRESVQAKLERVPALQQLGITVSVAQWAQNEERLLSGGTIPQFTMLSSVSPEVGAYGGRRWEITFHEARYNFPQVYVSNNTLATTNPPQSGDDSSTVLAIDTAVTHPGNALGGSFMLIMGDEKTIPLSYNVSGEEMAVALEALPSVHAVSVNRAPASFDPDFSFASNITSVEAGLERGLHLDHHFLRSGSLGGG